MCLETHGESLGEATQVIGEGLAALVADANNEIDEFILGGQDRTFLRRCGRRRRRLLSGGGCIETVVVVIVDCAFNMGAIIKNNMGDACETRDENAEVQVG